jgi:hypothetical protein
MPLPLLQPLPFATRCLHDQTRKFVGIAPNPAVQRICEPRSSPCAAADQTKSDVLDRRRTRNPLNRNFIAFARFEAMRHAQILGWLTTPACFALTVTPRANLMRRECSKLATNIANAFKTENPQKSATFRDQSGFRGMI